MFIYLFLQQVRCTAKSGCSLKPTLNIINENCDDIMTFILLDVRLPILNDDSLSLDIRLDYDTDYS